MRFMEARPDGRAVVYAHIQSDPLVARAADLLAAATTTQRLLARAVMNGESSDPSSWRTMFPTLFGSAAPGPGDPVRDRSEAILEASLAVADRGGEGVGPGRIEGDAVGVADQRQPARQVGAAPADEVLLLHAVGVMPAGAAGGEAERLQLPLEQVEDRAVGAARGRVDPDEGLQERDEVQSKAVAATAAAASVLTRKFGLSVRDAAEMLGVSHQRIQQLSGAKR